MNTVQEAYELGKESGLKDLLGMGAKKLPATKGMQMAEKALPGGNLTLDELYRQKRLLAGASKAKPSTAYPNLRKPKNAITLEQKDGVNTFNYGQN